jgi:hypothetical protein
MLNRSPLLIGVPAGDSGIRETRRRHALRRLSARPAESECLERKLTGVFNRETYAKCKNP